MKILRFNLSGKTAFFKNPEVNESIYFTFNNIHKVAVLGILGACLGLKGYNQQGPQDLYPQFYEVLKDVKIGIKPNTPTGSFRKKAQTFTNSTMFFNQNKNNEGAVLIVKQYWLEDPDWDIYVLLDDGDVSKSIEASFKNKNFRFIPYLGTNDHIADIKEIKFYENVAPLSEVNRVDSLFSEFDFEIKKEAPKLCNFKDRAFVISKYQESLPKGLLEDSNMYDYEKFIFTTMNVEKKRDVCVYKVGDENISFI